MISSQNMEKDVLFKIYQNSKTVFRLRDIALLTGETRYQSLTKKLNYYVHTSKILNPRKGIYAKKDYNREEMACSVFAPSYISLEYVLQKAGVVFQFDSQITAGSAVVTILQKHTQTKT